MKKLETITFKQKKKSSIKRLTLGLFVLGITSLQAQVQNNGSLFIGNTGTVFVGAGAFTFGSGGSTETTRTTATYGKLVFGSAATAAGAANAHFLNGYASSSSAAFTFPVGQASVYAPARVSSSVAAVDVAYFRGAPLVPGFDTTTLDGKSTTEYWNIKGTGAANVTLTWRADSNLGNFGIDATASNLTIAGFDGSKWVKIASTKDATSILGGASTFAAGSITTDAAVNLASYEFFTLASSKGSCAPLVAFSGITRTWNGTSWDVQPTLADNAVINGINSSPGSFVCNALTLNGDLILTGTQSIEIVNGVTGTGKIIMASESSVVQRASGVTRPNIVLTKRTRATMRRFDYIYWGTPIAGNFFSQISGAKTLTGAPDAFDLKYKYATGGTGWQTLTATETGRGFITRVKEQAPFIDATATDFINFTFTGVANNGDITVPITNNPASPNGGSSHELLANPYPSAIDANKFLTENAGAIDGAIYIWTAATGNSNTAAYAQADYIAYSLAGSVVPGPIAETFNGNIASGQGFKVKSLTNAGTVTFNNCMRVTTGNTNFYKTKAKTAADAPKDRFKLNLKGANGVFSQILIAYLPEATSGYDRMYDAGRNSVSTVQLFSIFEGDGRRLAINARPTFEASDIVPIGVSKATAGTAEAFTISIAEKEGVFATAQPVYIYDTVTNTYHDLSKGDFSLTADATQLDRYKVAYTASTLSKDTFENNGVVAMMNNKTITLNATIPLKGIEVYDLTGRKILEAPINDALSSTTPFSFPKAVYIVKAKLNNGTVASFKLINKN